MIATVIGQFATVVGHIRHDYVNPTRDAFTLRHRHFALPADNYRAEQAPSIVVDIEHERPVGHVRHLERAPDGRLWAVADAAIDDDTRYGVWWFSPSTLSRNDYTAITLNGLALVKQPGTLGLPPVRILSGDIDRADDRAVWTRRNMEPFERSLLRRAVTIVEHRRTRADHSTPILIHGHPDLEQLYHDSLGPPHPRQMLYRDSRSPLVIR